jgi:hypothetical protein
MVDTVLLRVTAGGSVLLGTPSVQEYGSYDEARPAPLDIRDSFDSALDECERIARPRLEDLRMNVDVDPFQIAREPVQQSAVAELAQAFASEENGAPRPDARSSPAHPRRGTAPYTPDRYLR